MMGVKSSKQTIVFGLLSLAIIAFIFSNSATWAVESNETSTGLMSWLRPLLAPFFDSEEVMHKFVRKAAHFAEFGALGFCVCMFLSGLKSCFWRGSLVFLPLFVLLSVGVIDEFIQSFFDRTSAVKDVILDFSGGVCGLVFGIFVDLWLNRRKKKRG